MEYKRHRESLSPGYRLHWYEIKKVLGRGCFGITYLAVDRNLEQHFAIKEYLPVDLCVRQDAAIQPVDHPHQKEYREGLTRFISEARTLARFNHPNIVRVLSVFEENDTAYMVMGYEEGESLDHVLTKRRFLPEDELKSVALPILEGLEYIHKGGFVHRDIKPANIYLREDGSPVLLDFGSARQAFGGETGTLTSVVSPGYAPFEQYSGKGEQQGPWTDIYGMAATMYRAVVGKTPTDAIARSESIFKTSEDTLVMASEVAKGRYSPTLLQSIDHALMFNPSDRPQSVIQWVAELKGEREVPDLMDFLPRVHNPDARLTNPTLVAPRPAKRTKPPAVPRETDRRSSWPRAIMAGVAFGALAIGWYQIIGVGDQSGGVDRPDEPVIAKEENRTSLIVRDESPVSKSSDGQANKKLQRSDKTDVRESVKREPKTPATKESLPVATQAPIVADATPDRNTKRGNDKDAKGSKSAVTKTVAVAETSRDRKVQESEFDVENSAPDPADTKSATKRSSDKEILIAFLLTAAEHDIEALQLTSPKESNAYGRYKEVLSLDSGNTEAKRGLRRIIDLYLRMARRSIDRQNYDVAQRYLVKAKRVNPNASGITDLQHDLDEIRGSRVSRAGPDVNEAYVPPSRELVPHSGVPRAEPVPRPRESFSRLLTRARNALNEGRLFSPPGNSAIDLYRRAKQLQPGSGSVKQGLVDIGNQLIRLADDASAKGKFDRAMTYLDQAESLLSDRPEIRSARWYVQERRASHERALARQRAYQQKNLESEL